MKNLTGNKEPAAGDIVVPSRDSARRDAEELQMRKQNDHLEENIATRTAQMEAANRELEAFTYSVSHDLRAPLRQIGGFSRILIEDFGDAMPAEARAHLERIGDAVRRAGLMVDGLLSLARLGRQSLALRQTPLNPIVDQTISVLEPEWEEREIDWRVAPLPSIVCDPILIAQVFQNLLSNAIKYSRGRTPAVIEVDSFRDAGNVPVIFVRDNGAGFDMKYAAYLFGVFRRLHSDSEFEGTGLGLATVHRILEKHGGRIWAEAEVDRGATFFFTVEAGTEGTIAP